MFVKNPILKISSALVLFGLLLSLVFYGQEPLREWLFRAGEPLLSSITFLRGFFLPRDKLRSVIEENSILKAENAELENLRSSYDALHKALVLEQETGANLLLVPVLYYGKEIGKEFLLTDRGRESGVFVGQPAVNAYGLLVGVVRESGDRFSRIEIASNPGETFEVELIPLGTRALAQGVGNRTFTLELLPADVPIQRGDYVALLGVGGITGGRYNFLIGQVASLKKSGSSVFKNGTAILLAKPELLRELFISLPPRAR